MTPHDPIFSVEGQVVVLTGACGLVGRTLAKAFHERSAKLVLVDLRESGPEQLARDLGGDTIGVVCDVSLASEVADLVTAAYDRFGRVDVLVNAHQHKPEGFLEAQAESFPEELWDAIIDANLKGTFLSCRAFGQRMLKDGRGSIINLASTYGLVSSNPGLYEDNSMGNPVAYSASKGGIIMLTKYLGVHWAARGVRVNCISPHGIWNHHEEGFESRFSAMSPMGRMMRVEEIVGATLFLASDASTYITGSNLLADGGWSAW